MAPAPTPPAASFDVMVRSNPVTLAPIFTVAPVTRELAANEVVVLARSASDAPPRLTVVVFVAAAATPPASTSESATALTLLRDSTVNAPSVSRPAPSPMAMADVCERVWVTVAPVTATNPPLTLRPLP